MPNNRFAAVQLTLLSVIVALILENLLNQVSGSEALATWTTPIPWLQAAVVAVTVITIWSGFALILSLSDRPPATVDFVYPFGLLITLSLAANSLNTDQLWQFFMHLGLSSAFAYWALCVEQNHIEQSGATTGVRRAALIQGVDTLLCFGVMAAVLFVPVPEWLLIVILSLMSAIQIAAAAGTMQGWRYTTSENFQSNA